MLLDKFIHEFETYHPGIIWTLGMWDSKYLATCRVGDAKITHIGVTPTEAFEGMMLKARRKYVRSSGE